MRAYLRLHFFMDKESDQLHCFRGMNCRSGNSETEPAQSGGLPSVTAWDSGDTNLRATDLRCVSNCRVSLSLDTQKVRPRPATKKSCLSGVKCVDGIPFLIGNHVGSRDPTYPVRSALPGADDVRIVHADRVVGFDDTPATLCRLPFQRVAGQTFACRTWPYKPPKILLSFGTLSPLDAGGHFLELVPCAGRCTVPILLKKISSIKQNSYVGMKWHGN